AITSVDFNTGLRECRKCFSPAVPRTSTRRTLAGLRLLGAALVLNVMLTGLSAPPLISEGARWRRSLPGRRPDGTSAISHSTS
ncbi:hypothetical protein, partial [Klebsiella variicola]|uniref:hypothetical protein n=1 Tax=Klebsiella variicola TaxID=244366 RepID=UPI00273096EC